MKLSESKDAINNIINDTEQLCYKPDGLLVKLFKHKVREPEKNFDRKEPNNHTGRREVSRFHTRGESEESIAYRGGSMQAGGPSFGTRAGVTSNSTKRLISSKFFLKENKPFFCDCNYS